MIDITGPKVLVPTVLFALTNLAMKPTPGLLMHALLFALLSWAIIKFVFKFTLTLADLMVPLALFILLAPGVLLTLPPSGGLAATAVHTLVFAILFATLRGLFPQFY
jgi:hypothetical protein